MRVWGRAPQQFATGRDIYQQPAAAEPHATEARKEELRTLARAQAQHAVPFWDVSVSVSKSVILFYGGLLAAAEQARQAGDVAAAEERQAAKAWESIMEGNRGAALEYLQDEAGNHPHRLSPRLGCRIQSGAGKWEHARDWVIGSFRQYTSRDGDPQLHGAPPGAEQGSHGAGREVAQARLPVAVGYQGAAAAIAAAVMGAALTRGFGVAWVQRADGHGREIGRRRRRVRDRRLG